MKTSIINSTYMANVKADIVNNKNKQLCINNNCIQKDTHIPSETYKAYALAKPSFKASVLNINNVDLLLTDEATKPHIKIELMNDSNFNDKSGLSAIYETAVHDQLYNLLRRNPNIKDMGSDVNSNSRRLDITCTEADLVSTLKMMHEEFVNIELKKQYIDEGKKLAPIGYYLYVLGQETPRNYKDVPNGMSQDDYQKMLNKISYEDVQTYSNDFLKNSDTKITLSVNRKFYNNNKEDIADALGKIIVK